MLHLLVESINKMMMILVVVEIKGYKVVFHSKISLFIHCNDKKKIQNLTYKDNGCCLIWC